MNEYKTGDYSTIVTDEQWEIITEFLIEQLTECDDESHSTTNQQQQAS